MFDLASSFKETSVYHDRKARGRQEHEAEAC